MNQLELPQAHRSTDPATSHQEPPDRENRVHAMAALVGRFPDCTAAELVRNDLMRGRLRWNGQWWLEHDKFGEVYTACTRATKRLSDAHAAGLIEVAGERICTVTGKKARVWRAM